MAFLEEIKQHPTDETLDALITEDELDQALKDTKLGKSPGPGVFLYTEVLVWELFYSQL